MRPVRRDAHASATGMPPRFFVAEAEPEAGCVVSLSGEEREHARVRRLRDGDQVVLLNGRGAFATGILVENRSGVAVHAVRYGVGEPHLWVHVALAAAEPSRVEWAIEKGTECGAASFSLFAASRSQPAHVRALSERTRRLSKIASEAMKQCGRSVVPEIRGVFPLEAILERPAGPLVALIPNQPRLRDWPGDEPTLTLLVGPEGGFSPEELEAMDSAGALLVGLGPRVLRLETAVVAALSILVDGDAA